MRIASGSFATAFWSITVPTADCVVLSRRVASADLDGLAHAADPEREVDARALAHLEDHGDCLFRSPRPRPPRCTAGDEVERLVDAVGVVVTRVATLV